jgi:hypothetical protein
MSFSSDERTLTIHPDSHESVGEWEIIISGLLFDDEVHNSD